MLTTVWFCMNSKTPSLAITMKGVSLLMRPEATSGSAVTPILSAAAQQIGRAISPSSWSFGSHDDHAESKWPDVMHSPSSGQDRGSKIFWLTSIPKGSCESCPRVHGIRRP